MNVPTLLLGLIVVVPAAPAVQASPYVDLIDYPHQEANAERFHDLEGRLQQGFDNICGDTFCEGEYSDIRALKMRCAVDGADGTVHDCVWLFAASNVWVDDRFGIVTQSPTWRCTLPLLAGTTVEPLFAALAARDPLHDPLPGTQKSIYDALTECIH